MKQRDTYQVYLWNMHTGKWDMFRMVEAYSAKQACHFITHRYPIRRADLSARKLTPQNVQFQNQQNQAAEPASQSKPLYRF